MAHVKTYGPDGDGDGYNDAYEELLVEDSGAFCKSMRADVNFDKTVNSIDLGLIASRYFTIPRVLRYDQNGDTVLNSVDLGLTASVFNQNIAACP